MTVALVASGSVTVVAGIGTGFEDWVPLSSTSTLQLVAASLMIIGGYVFSVSAMRVGEIAIIAPFRYTSLLWALLLGFLVFAEWPTLLTMIGAAIVVATGVYTFYRERRLLREGLTT